MNTSVANSFVWRNAPLPILIPAAIVGMGMFFPFVYLLLRAFEADLGTLQSLLLRTRNLELLRNTLMLTGGVVVVSTLLAVPLAWLVVRSDLRGRRWITLLGALPLAIPGYVMAYALLGLGGHYGLMARVFDITMARPQGYWGALAALSLYTYPYLFLNLRAALQGIDPALEETARSLGYSPFRAFVRVTLPQLRPALLAGWLVIGLYVLGDFGAVALMRYEVFSYAIYIQYAAAFDRVYAAWLSLMLLAITAAFVLAEGRLLGRRRYARVGRGASRSIRPVALGRAAPLAWGFLTVLIAAAIGLPALMLGFWLWQAPPSAGELTNVLMAFGRSVGVAAPAAFITAMLAIPVAALAVRYPSPMAHAIERSTYFGYALPPLTLALAFVFFSLHTAPWLYQTATLLIAAYSLSFIALALGPVRSALLQARPSLEETARSLGRGPVGAFMQVTFPLLRRGVLAGMALVFVLVMKELPITFLLAPTGYTTLAVSVFSRTSEAMLAEAAPYAAAIVIFSVICIGVLLREEKPHEGR